MAKNMARRDEIETRVVHKLMPSVAGQRSIEIENAFLTQLQDYVREYRFAHGGSFKERIRIDGSAGCAVFNAKAALPDDPSPFEHCKREPWHNCFALQKRDLDFQIIGVWCPCVLDHALMSTM